MTKKHIASYHWNKLKLDAIIKRYDFTWSVCIFRTNCWHVV